MEHEPVLYEEVIKMLEPAQGETVLDVTLGLGGHAEGFIKKVGARGKLIAFDADKDNLEEAKKTLKPYEPQVTLINKNFRFLNEEVKVPVDIIFADLGLSSPHLDDGERGFSFRFLGPLDLRFNRNDGLTAAQWIASATEDEITQVLRDFGELRQAHRISKTIFESKPKTTFDLKESIEKCLGFRAKKALPQIFQALRIKINDEINVLKEFLVSAPALLKPGGRLGIISYHSLEDRLVKQTFRALSTPEIDDITGQVSREADFEVITKRPIVPTDVETAKNPRSRSAKFRILSKRK